MNDYFIYKAIDIFAGIGGIRLGFEQTGRVKVVFGCDYDPKACATYEKNFKDNIYGDITKIKEHDIPAHDIILAGFPCQAFSIAGKKAGFEDTRGTLFFDVARMIKYHQPKAFLLENVKGLMSHQKGETLKVILNVLREDLGYTVFHKILNSSHFGVPQNRQRIYLVGFKNSNAKFYYPEGNKGENLSKISSVFENETVSAKYYLSDTYLETLRRHRARHEAKGNGFGYQIIEPTGLSNTIMVGGMGRERNLVIDHRLINRTPVTKIKGAINKENIRKLTPREWARLQGYPDSYKLADSDASAYKQLGNSVSVPVIYALAKEIINTLDNS